MNSFSNAALNDLMGQLKAEGLLVTGNTEAGDPVEVTDDMVLETAEAELEESDSDLSEEEKLLQKSEGITSAAIDIQIVRDLFNYIIVSQGRMADELASIKSLLSGTGANYTGNNASVTAAVSAATQRAAVVKNLTPEQRHLIEIGAITIGDPDLSGEIPLNNRLTAADVLTDNPHAAALSLGNNTPVATAGKMTDAQRKALMAQHMEEAKRLAATPPPFVKK